MSKQSANPSSGSDALPVPPQRTAPAWLFSTLVHVVAVVALVLFVRQRQQPRPDEPSRSVGIVLAANDMHDVAYVESSAASGAAKSASTAGPELPKGAVTDASVLDSPDLPGRNAPNNPSGLLQGLVQSGGGRRPILPGLGDEAILAADPLLNAGPTPVLGPTTTLSVFGAASKGRSFVLLIDCSKSMGGEGLGAIEAAQAELSQAFSALSAEQTFQIVAYNQNLSATSDKMQSGTDEHKRKAAEFLSGVVAHGQTEHKRGIFAALRNKPEVIYVFSDGGEPPLHPADIRIIGERARGMTVIHCIHFGHGERQESEPFLKRLAEACGGTYRYVDMSG